MTSLNSTGGSDREIKILDGATGSYDSHPAPDTFAFDEADGLADLLSEIETLRAGSKGDAPMWRDIEAGMSDLEALERLNDSFILNGSVLGVTDGNLEQAIFRIGQFIRKKKLNDASINRGINAVMGAPRKNLEENVPSTKRVQAVTAARPEVELRRERLGELLRQEVELRELTGESEVSQYDLKRMSNSDVEIALKRFEGPLEMPAPNARLNDPDAGTAVPSTPPTTEVSTEMGEVEEPKITEEAIDPNDVLEDMASSNGAIDEEDEEETAPTDAPDQPSIPSNLQAEIDELDQKIRAKEQAIATAAAKPGVTGFFSRGWRNLTGAKAADEQELVKLLAERAAKKKELEAAAMEVPIVSESTSSLSEADWKKALGIEPPESISSSGILNLMRQNKVALLTVLLLAKANGAIEPPIVTADKNEFNSASPAALVESALPQPEIPLVTETSSTPDVTPSAHPTLWAQILEKANGDTAQTATMKMEFLQANGAKIVDATDDMGEIEDNEKLWNETLRPYFEKYQFSHPKFGMGEAMKNAKNLRAFLRSIDGNLVNWMGAEAVFAVHPESFKNLQSVASTPVTNAPTSSADITLPSILPEMAGDDLDLTPYFEAIETKQPSPWYFETHDGIIDPSINNNEDEDDLDPEDLELIDEGDLILPKPKAFDPTDVPEPFTFNMAQVAKSKPQYQPEPENPDAPFALDRHLRT